MSVLSVFAFPGPVRVLLTNARLIISPLAITLLVISFSGLVTIGTPSTVFAQGNAAGTPPNNLRVPAELDLKKGDLLRQLMDDYKRAKEVSASGSAMKKLAKRLKGATKRVDVPLTYYYYGLALQHLNEFDAAKHAFTTATEGNPRFFEAFTRLAEVNLRLREIDAAHQGFLKALEAHPGYPAALEGSAIIHARRGELEEAHRKMELAFTTEKNDRREGFVSEIAEARSGPSWAKEFNAESKNFRVRTDVSKEFAENFVPRLVFFLPVPKVLIPYLQPHPLSSPQR